MVTSNTETGIAVTYDDSDNTLDFVLGSITSLGTIGTGVWQGTAIAQAYIANDAINGDKIADDAIDSEHYADGSIDNAHLADDAVDSDEIAAGAIDLAHMSVNSIDSDQYVDGSIDNAHLADDAVGADELAANAVVTASIVDDNVSFAKLENRYTAKVDITTYTGAVSIDWAAGTTFKMGSSLTGAIEFDFTNFKQGQVITFYNLTGSETITFDSDAGTSETFNKVGAVDYDGTTTNMIQVECIDDSTNAIFNYSVAAYTSDVTPS